jgi:hypothetical protein
VSTVEIPLTRGHVALVDAADAERALAHKWSAQPAGHTIYAQRSVKREDGRWTTQRLHQFLTGYAATDHRNGNGLDNRRANLREATQGQNVCNQIRQKGASGFRGVTWWKRGQNWKAQISSGGKNYHLGYFAIAEEAARAYDAAARALHGEFATLNFPKLGERAA